MSDAVSALNGTSFDGIAHVADAGLHGMISLRGDPAAAGFRKAVTDAAGLAMPGQREASWDAGGQGLFWMSPDELLLVCAYDEAPDKLARLSTALAGQHALAVNVSDARAVFEVSGPGARESIAKLCPVDLSPAAFAPGQFRRTRMAQVPVAFWMPDEGRFRVICFRSVARYVFDLLRISAEPGSEVGYFPAG